MKNIDLLKNLNNKQKEIVSEKRKNLLILAGAGSGKTLVLIRKIAWLIYEENCSPKSILAVTFTNKAAIELKIRIKSLLINNYQKDIWIGTFHSFAYYLLRIHYLNVGLTKKFQIIDTYDQKIIIKRILKKLSLKDKIFSVENILKYINNKKNNLLNNYFYKNNIYNINLSKIYDEYQNFCKKTEVIDFNELIFYLYKLFLYNPKILKIYQKRFQNILIDEFQDTNDIQYKLISLLYNKYYDTKVVFVGDDDQSIYGWRGAKIDNINSVLKEFDEVKTVLLEQNYRSTSNILETANRLISYNNSRLKKKLWTNANNGDLITIYYALNEFDEAEYIAKYIKKKTFKEENKLNNYAILYRNNSQSRILEEIMLKFSIPYKIYGGIQFFERQEIKNTLSYLRLISNHNDDISFEKIVNIPKRGIGDITLNIIKHIANKYSLTLWKSSFFLLKNKNFLNKTSFNALKKFITLIIYLKNNTKKQSLSKIIKQTIKKSGLWDMYKKNYLFKQDNTKINNLKEFINAAKYFTKKKIQHKKKENILDIKDNNLLIDFLSQTLLLNENINKNNEEKNNYVQLMTIHSSKGLEFSEVFIIGMEEGIFPNKISFNEKSINEERRLAYVGITRAKKKLTLTYTKKRFLHGKEINSIRSRFINELPKNCIKNINYIQHNNVLLKKSSFFIKKKYSIGQIVYHKIFGQGTIIKIEILKKNEKLQIKFDNTIIKWIMSDYIQSST
ncbi:AAA family ATPase [Enterobacteriaceae endosymbiont of Donacia cincticornis]|uniref:UvrD-helicase domain-containing protein n=1 Tax=Enterobacteriaceae endosymbiont of Donacia cincticornis TaxID=2675773 RepID=UPI0014493BF3|nr:UvrD-helicase domain-containing protein [Enterobacteriaceae endosymbiont of Donacia cincticornis]QJC36085.1 AAA family ATPase [Enterobacteriaceae endosymbiont of Donacia cincticornis]